MYGTPEGGAIRSRTRTGPPRGIRAPHRNDGASRAQALISSRAHTTVDCKQASFAIGRPLRVGDAVVQTDKGPNGKRDTARSSPGDLDERPGGIPDLFRRMMTIGFSGLFTTEAAIRGALGDTVPREWVDFVAEQSERTRNEFMQRLAREFAAALQDIDLVSLTEQLLEGRTVEVKAEFRLRPLDEEPEPSESRGGKRERATSARHTGTAEPAGLKHKTRNRESA